MPRQHVCPILVQRSLKKTSGNASGTIGPHILLGPTFYSALQALFEHWGTTKVGQGLLTCEQTERFATT